MSMYKKKFHLRGRATDSPISFTMFPIRKTFDSGQVSQPSNVSSDDSNLRGTRKKQNANITSWEFRFDLNVCVGKFEADQNNSTYIFNTNIGAALLNFL